MFAYNKKILANIARQLRKYISGVEFRHFKGGLYVVENLAVDSEGDFIRVIYHGMNDDLYWDRPFKMFVSETDKEKYPDADQAYRFCPERDRALNYEMRCRPFVIKDGNVEIGPAILNHKEWLIESGLISENEYHEQLADNRLVLGYVAPDGVWFFKENGGYDEKIESFAQMFGDDISHTLPVYCGKPELNEEKTAAAIGDNIKIIKQACPSKMFTFEFNYNFEDDNFHSITFCAHTDREALRLFNDYFACEYNREADYDSVSVVYNEDDADEYGDNYGTPEEFEERQKLRDVTISKWAD